MFLSNKTLQLIFFASFFIQINTYLVHAKDTNAREIYSICKDYYNWVNKNYDITVDSKTLFNMGKCQGIMETMGRTMTTLCLEKKRNVNINKKLTANLNGIKTIDLIESFLKHASQDNKLRSYSASSYLADFISQKWPCQQN